MSDEGSKTVLAGPEFGIVHIMRPYKGFELTYQGQPGDTPIYLCEANRPYDELALRKVPGIDKHLIAGLPCVVGSRVLIWIPDIDTIGVGSHPYPLGVAWRFRNLFDHRNSTERMPYHIPKQGLGTGDTGPVDLGPRVVIPASFDGAIYQQAEPVPGAIFAQSSLHPNRAVVVSGPVVPPLMPDGIRGAVAQGIAAYDAAGYYLGPRSVIYELQAAGDELLLFYMRPDLEITDPWDFAVRDILFSKYFGVADGVEYPEKGVYVSFGISP